jgi:hypothetical protein
MTEGSSQKMKMWRWAESNFCYHILSISIISPHKQDACHVRFSLTPFEIHIFGTKFGTKYTTLKSLFKKLKYQISFGLKNENHLSKSGEVAIRMRITYNCTRVDLLMGVSVAPELWNKSKQVAKGRGTNRRGYDAVHINAVIAQYRKAADDAMDYFTSKYYVDI